MRVVDSLSSRFGLRQLLSVRTRQALKFDLLRLRARLLHSRRRPPPSTRLHFGCGARRIVGWLNVDVVGSEFDVDLAAGALPWVDDSFEAIVSQHVIEHLEVRHELRPLLGELRRVSRDGGEIWLACPDLSKVCAAYEEDRATRLLADRQARWPSFDLRGLPSQQMVNELFHQGGEHKNLFDFEILRWLLEDCGFEQVTRRIETDLLSRFPEFPVRGDDFQTLYVSAVVRKLRS